MDVPARTSIYHWYNANNRLPDTARVLEYAFTKDFKRYAPHEVYTTGRFFDLRSDLNEMAGEKGRQASWGNWFHTGLDQETLSAEQQSAFAALGKVLEANRYVAVKELKIDKRNLSLTNGQTAQLEVTILPANATRNNVIWESSDPTIASIDKFGVLTAHKPGVVKVSVYSWDDAHPVANNSPVTYSETGIADSISVLVR